MIDTNKLALDVSVIKDAIDSRLKDLHTQLPGVIKSYDAVSNRAEVYLAIQRVFVTEALNGEKVFEAVNLPLLINVPVCFPSFGGFSVTLPVKDGDECLVSFCERDISRWLADGVTAEPPIKRFHSLSDAVVLVGLRSGANNIADLDVDGLVLRDDNKTVVIKLNENGVISIGADSEVEVTAPTVTINGNATVNGNISVTGDLSVTGSSALSANVTSAGVNISSTHTHTQTVDAGGDAQQPTSPPL